MKSIKSKILMGMLAVVMAGAVLIGVITALLNARGIDALMEKTLGPATQIAADAVQWRMDGYWTALQEAAASDIFRNAAPMDPELETVREEIAQRIYGRHKLLTQFLICLGVGEAAATADACKMEHDLSEETFSQITAFVQEHSGQP